MAKLFHGLRIGGSLSLRRGPGRRRGVLAAAIVLLIVLLASLCVFARYRALRLDPRLGEEVMIARIDTELHLLRDCAGDVTLRVTAVASTPDSDPSLESLRAELPGGEALVRFRWAGRSLFRIDVTDPAGQQVRSIVCDGQAIDLGDGTQWPLSAIREACSMKPEHEPFRARMWPLDILRAHLFPFTGGPGLEGAWSDYAQLYTTSAASLAHGQMCVRLRLKANLWNEQLEESIYTFTLADPPQLTAIEMRDQEWGLFGLGHWAIASIARFDGAASLSAESEESFVVPERFQRTAGPPSAGGISSIVLESHLGNLAQQDLLLFRLPASTPRR